MGSKNNNVIQSYTNNAGGLNLAISRTQANSNDAVISFDVFYKSYMSFGSINKRSGKKLFKTTVESNAANHFTQFTIGSSTYSQVVDSTGAIKSLNLTGGVTGASVGTVDLSWKPTYSTLGGKCYRGAKRTSTVVASCETTGLFASIYSISANNVAPLYDNLKATFTADPDYYTVGSKSLKVRAVTATALTGGLISFGVTYTPAAPINFTNLALWYDLLYGAMGTANLAYQSISMETTLYSGSTYHSYKKYESVSDNGRDFEYDYWMTKNINPATATTIGTSGAFQISAATRIRFEIFIDNPTGTIPSFYLDDVKTVDTRTGLSTAIDNSGWTMVTDPYYPEESKYLANYDGRLFVLDDNNFYYSAVGNGSEWTDDSSSAGIDDGDGDKVKGVKVLGKQLIAYKKGSIHRIKYTGDDVIPYRREAIYSEGNKLDGVGLSNQSTLCNVALGNEEGLNANSYHIFLGSDRKIYALGETGSAISIGKRVNSRLTSLTDADLALCFAVYEPKNKLYKLYYPTTGASTCANCLVYCVDSKAWTEYRQGNINTSLILSNGITTFEIMGGSDKYLYKMYSETSLSTTDYYDAVGGSSSLAISGEWKSVYSAYGNPRRSKQMVDTEVVVETPHTSGGTHTDCPIKVNLYNELGTSASSTINTVSTEPECTSSILNKLYGRYLSTEFTNKQINQSMVVLYWTARVKQTRGLK